MIRECDGAAIKDAAAFIEIVGAKKEGDTIALKVEREKKPLEIAVKLESPATRAAASVHRPLRGADAEHAGASRDKDGHEYGGVYRSADGGETWTRVNSINPAADVLQPGPRRPEDEKYLYVARRLAAPLDERRKDVHGRRRLRSPLGPARAVDRSAATAAT